MGFFKSVTENAWNNIKVNTVATTESMVGGYRQRINAKKGDVVYVNPRYKNVGVYVAKQFAMNNLGNELHGLFPKYRKYLEKRNLEYMRKKQDLLSGTVAENKQKQAEAGRSVIIHNGEKRTERWGRITAEGGHEIIAKDIYGTPVPESLMIYYDSETPHTVEEVTYKDGLRISNSYSTKTLCHIDITPIVSASNNKDIVMTRVQGRDQSRKELISGGDYSFQVQGAIRSGKSGVYPSEAVKRFINIMTYGGIVNVNFVTFWMYGVTKVLITDHSLGAIEHIDEQPYSFNCVAVEPDDEIVIAKDTIETLNYKLETNPMNKWHKMILNNKLAQVTANTVTENVAGAIEAGVGIGLEKLIPNI